MDLQLHDKVALVTGSSRGIGREIALALLREGCRVAFNSREIDRGSLQFEGLPDATAVGIPGDVRSPEEAAHIVAEVQERLGGLDILICNVGSGKSVPPGHESFDEWQRVFALNLWSTTNMVEAARKALCASRGAVVCISSICGSGHVPGAPLTYSVAKAALNAYVRGISRPLARDGVRVNAIAPGNILFEGSVWARKLEESASDVEEMLEREVALATLGETADVAAAALWLASPQAKFVTGKIVEVDGGQTRS